jgi:WD40 repeat protein
MFQHQAKETTVKPALSSRWSACLQTLDGHNSTVYSVAFSHNSTKLASASSDNTVKIWDATSGACLHTLDSHSDWVNSVAFSHDSTKLASASSDKTVKIWDATSGACLQTLDVGRTLYALFFNSNSSCLYTEIGTIAIESLQSISTVDTAEPKNPQYLGIGISSDEMWITQDGENIVWVPSEYRPLCLSVCPNRQSVGIGVRSGQVWMCSIEV